MVENQGIKQSIDQMKVELIELKEEAVADELKIFEVQRELEMKDLTLKIEKEREKERAYERGGQEEVMRTEEDYDIKQCKKKAEDILARMKDKIERAPFLV